MSNGKPKISVLMPVYNAEKFLREAIESILGQSFRFFEFIIVNDKSTDASKKIILSYSDSRIRYLENKKNLGVAGALNVGLEQTRCSLIARMDADDISLPDRFALQHAEMSKNKDVVVIASNFDIINEEGKLLFQNRHCITPEEIYYSLHFRNCL